MSEFFAVENVPNVCKEIIETLFFQELVADHKHHMQSIFKHLRDLLDLAKVFHNSKSGNFIIFGYLKRFSSVSQVFQRN